MNSMDRAGQSLGLAAEVPGTGLVPRDGRGFTAFVQLGLIACMAVAVLMFGGVEPRALTLIQTVVFSIFFLGLWLPALNPLARGMPWQGPAVLLAYVGMQAALLPVLNQFFGGQVLRLVLYLCVFLLAARLGQEPVVRRRILLALVWMGLLEALYGLVIFLSGSRMILHIEKFAYLSRATGTYVNPNHFAGFLGMILPLGLGMAFYHLDRLRFERDPARMNQHFWAVVFYVTGGMVVFVGVIVSQSRLGLISVVAGLLATGLLSLAATWNRKGVAVALSFFLLLSLLAGLWIGLEPIAVRYRSAGESYEGRRAIWADTMEIIKERPWLGSGLGSFQVEYTRHQRVYLQYLVDHAHNDYLQFTAELGIPGALLLFGLIFWLLGRGILAVRKSRRPPDWLLSAGLCGGVVALLIHSLADFNLQIPANAMVFAAALGLLHAVSAREARRQSGQAAG